MPPSKGKGKHSKSIDKKDYREKSSKPSSLADTDGLHLYSDLEDFVEDFEEHLSSKPTSPKKRCLRSSSNEEKESSPVNILPGPSNKLSPPLPKKLDTSLPSVKKSEVSRSKKSKSPKTKDNTSKEEKSQPKGKTRGKKTGSCASNRYIF